jgi:hypothetical protein
MSSKAQNNPFERRITKTIAEALIERGFVEIPQNPGRTSTVLGEGIPATVPPSALLKRGAKSDARRAALRSWWRANET